MNEDHIEEGDVVYDNDNLKVIALFSMIEMDIPSNTTIERLGKRNDNSNYKRIIKMKVNSKQNRDEILKKASKLKSKDAPWNSIYLMKDLHPSILQENNRLRIKKKNLQKLDEDKDKDIKIEKGCLIVDGTTVDQNMFFM